MESNRRIKRLFLRPCPIKSKSTHPCPASKSARVVIDLEQVLRETFAALEAAFLVAAAIDDAIIRFDALWLVRRKEDGGRSCRSLEASESRQAFETEKNRGYSGATEERVNGRQKEINETKGKEEEQTQCGARGLTHVFIRHGTKEVCHCNQHQRPSVHRF